MFSHLSPPFFIFYYPFPLSTPLLEYTRHAPTQKPLYLPFLLPKIFFSHTSIQLVLSLSSNFYSKSIPVRWSLLHYLKSLPPYSFVFSSFPSLSFFPLTIAHSHRLQISLLFLFLVSYYYPQKCKLNEDREFLSAIFTAFRQFVQILEQVWHIVNIQQTLFSFSKFLLKLWLVNILNIHYSERKKKTLKSLQLYFTHCLSILYHGSPISSFSDLTSVALLFSQA